MQIVEEQIAVLLRPRRVQHAAVAGRKIPGPDRLGHVGEAVGAGMAIAVSSKPKVLIVSIDAAPDARIAWRAVPRSLLYVCAKALDPASLAGRAIS